MVFTILALFLSASQGAPIREEASKEICEDQKKRACKRKLRKPGKEELCGKWGKSNCKASCGHCDDSNPTSLVKGDAGTDSIPIPTTFVTGKAETESFRLKFRQYNGGYSHEVVSPWHDIPLKRTSTSTTYNAVIEIPKWTKAKMEVTTKEEYNPIAQDKKENKLRDYRGPIFWNYGMIPQTWENPGVRHNVGRESPNTEVLLKIGDNDPVDIVEIGEKAIESGSVVEIKVLGALAMVDSGELDWKLIVIDVNDPLASELNDVADVEEKMPYTINGIREWFRWYKYDEHKGLNVFGHEGKCLGADFAKRVIKETHVEWQKLRDGTIPNDGDLWIGAAKKKET